MAKSMLELHPAEFAELDKSWKKLNGSFLRKVNIDSIKDVLKAEVKVFEAGSGRVESEINSFIELKSQSDIDKAMAWFQKQKAVCLVAFENANKVSHLNKPDASHQRELKTRIKAADNAINFLKRV